MMRGELELGVISYDPGFGSTDAGQMVLDYGRRFRNLEGEARKSLQELRDLSIGRLTIGANESSTLYLLGHIGLFRRRHPGVKVRIRRSRSSRIPERLMRGELELGVISYDPAGSLLVSRTLYRDHLSFIVSPRHHLAGRDSVSIRELGEETFVAHDVVSPYRRHVVEKFQELDVPLRIRLEMPTVETIRKLVQRNEGVAFLPRMCVDQEIQQGVLREVRVPELQVERRIRLVHHGKRTLSRAARAFLELVGESRNPASVPPHDSTEK